MFYISVRPLEKYIKLIFLLFFKGILLRINFQSIIYMFMLFILPFFYPITYTNLQGTFILYYKNIRAVKNFFGEI